MGDQERFFFHVERLFNIFYIVYFFSYKTFLTDQCQSQNQRCISDVSLDIGIFFKRVKCKICQQLEGWTSEISNNIPQTVERIKLVYTMFKMRRIFFEK